MAEQNSVVTKYRRINLAKITSGAVSTIPKITHIAFGDGGLDASGNPKIPTETQTALSHEFCRYAVTSITYPVETTARYKVVIPRGEQTGKQFNEMALVDNASKLCAIKTMYTKQKDDDVIFTYEFDDEF